MLSRTSEITVKQARTAYFAVKNGATNDLSDDRIAETEAVIAIFSKRGFDVNNSLEADAYKFATEVCTGITSVI